MLRYFIFVIIVSVATKVEAQTVFFAPFEDSLAPGYRVSGSLDSTDWNCILQPYSNSPFRLKPSRLTSVSEYFQPFAPTFSKRRYSSIPHVGLLYAFGSAGTQTAKITYTQQTDTNHYLQFDYTKNFSNGAMRNANYDVNQFDFKWTSLYNRYAQRTELLFYSAIDGLNGGLLGDSLSNTLGLAFQEVKKADAISEQKAVKFQSAHYWSFIQNESIKTGIFGSANVHVNNRRYTETGDLSVLYTIVQDDSTSTMDFYQFSSVAGQAGYFFETKPFALSFGPKISQINYDNRNLHQDSVLLNMIGDVSYAFKKSVRLNSHLDINLAGALGEMTSQTQLSTDVYGWKFVANVLFERAYPNWNQRAYSGNNLVYSWGNKQLATRLKGNAGIGRSFGQQSLKVTAGIEQLTNEVLFIDKRFRQDTLTSISHIYEKVVADLHWKKMVFQPSLTFHQVSYDLIPALQFNARLGYQGTLGKRKKLQTVLGVEGAYYSGFEHTAFVPIVGTYTFSSSGTGFQPMYNVAVFGQFDLGFLRWFFRVENLEQIGNTAPQQEALGYPILPLQIRLGISWDLFN